MARHTPTIIAMTTLALPLSSTAIGALRQLAGARQERLKRLDEVVARIAAEDRLMLDEPLRNAHEALCAAWPAGI